ncbi:hypothetical protein evm_011987 [Chilo suppressalis]|nr:hypothetical protein evm_011987 [Chilo suppressalis]
MSCTDDDIALVGLTVGGQPYRVGTPRSAVGSYFKDRGESQYCIDNITVSTGLPFDGVVFLSVSKVPGLHGFGPPSSNVSAISDSHNDTASSVEAPKKRVHVPLRMPKTDYSQSIRPAPSSPKLTFRAFQPATDVCTQIQTQIQISKTSARNKQCSLSRLLAFSRALFSESESESESGVQSGRTFDYTVYFSRLFQNLNLNLVLRRTGKKLSKGNFLSLFCFVQCRQLKDDIKTENMC